MTATGDRLGSIGLLIPSSNTVMEPDLVRSLDGRAVVRSEGMFLAEPVTRETEIAMLDEQVEPAAGRLAAVPHDVAVFGCTSAGSIRGEAADREMREGLARTLGAPVLGVMSSLRTCLQELGVERLVLLTPYLPAMTEAVALGLDEFGFTVVRTLGMGIARNEDVGRVQPEQVLALARSSGTGGAEAVVIACTNLRALEARAELEAALGLPVLTSNSAVVTMIERELTKVPIDRH